MPINKSEHEKAYEDNESERILKRVKQESETVGRSSMKRVADDLTSHFKADDAEENQWTEVWGTRIGRFLGMLFFIFLVVYLVQTYILN